MDKDRLEANIRDFQALIDKFPGFKEKYDGLSADKVDNQTKELIEWLYGMVPTSDEQALALAIKATYTLGAWNEEFGKHATKQ